MIALFLDHNTQQVYAGSYDSEYDTDSSLIKFDWVKNDDEEFALVTYQRNAITFLTHDPTYSADKIVEAIRNIGTINSYAPNDDTNIVSAINQVASTFEDLSYEFKNMLSRDAQKMQEEINAEVERRVKAQVDTIKTEIEEKYYNVKLKLKD